jgi:hypothetical protein
LTRARGSQRIAPCTGRQDHGLRGSHARYRAPSLWPSPPCRARPRGDIAISEIHYHPAPREGRTEFVELTNTGKVDRDIGGWKLSRGVQFTFPPEFRLAPGKSAVVCEDADEFQKAFGDAARRAGVYEGKLSNGGETLRLVDAGATPSPTSNILQLRRGHPLPTAVAHRSLGCDSIETPTTLPPGMPGRRPRESPRRRTRPRVTRCPASTPRGSNRKLRCRA